MLKEAEEQRAEISRAIDELKLWLETRRAMYRGVQDFIQLGLRTGRISEYRTGGSHRKYLSRRMVATVAADSNHISRSLLLMNSRLIRLEKELSDLDEKIAEAS
jgi:hypothetical protein